MCKQPCFRLNSYIQSLTVQQLYIVLHVFSVFDFNCTLCVLLAISKHQYMAVSKSPHPQTNKKQEQQNKQKPYFCNIYVYEIYTFQSLFSYFSMTTSAVQTKCHLTQTEVRSIRVHYLYQVKFYRSGYIICIR